ncbi:hypothetical protein Aoki45_12530 [Algoriphagus sp. oki45]|nr:hypothetical protein Aoki45_12530 [Algoriphagus sp. oki45]
MWTKSFFILLVSLSLSTSDFKTMAQNFQKPIELSLGNLFYGNDNVVLIKLFWLNQDEIIGYRYENDIPKDLVLLNRQRLIKDSLSINSLFLEGYNSSSKNFISIQGLIQTGDHEAIVLHNFGSTKFEVKNERIQILSQTLPRSKPDISEKYFKGYELVHLDGFTLGYRAEMKKWITDADYWVYNWSTGKFALYEDSKHSEVTKNRYWDRKKDPETQSTYTHFLYNVVQTKEGFLFNLPLKNRFVRYNAETNQMQGYTFPDLKKSGQAWFAFYDRVWSRFFAVLDSGNEYNIYSLDDQTNSFSKLTTSDHQPLGFVGGKCYFREFTFKERRKDYYFDHYLVDLFPKLD